MKKHTKLYYEYFDYALTDFVIDELIGVKAVDINHIDARGMGGSKAADKIENLMAVSRDSHLLFGDKKEHKAFLKEAHEHFMKTRKPFVKDFPTRKEFDLYPEKYQLLIEKMRLDGIN